MKRAFFILVAIPLLLPAAALAQGDSLEEVEKDLTAVLKEMDAMSSELDRIQDLAAAPKATAIRVEISGGAGVPAPVSGRLWIGGKQEQEWEWTRAEREAFPGGAPIAFQAPVLPGTHAARFEVLHPSWKSALAVEFQANVRKGETFSLRLTLALPSGAAAPVLAPAKEK